MKYSTFSANCTVGFFLDTTDNVCVRCPRGTYTDEVWQENACEECPATHPTTIEEESTSVDDCKCKYSAHRHNQKLY